MEIKEIRLSEVDEIKFTTIIDDESEDSMPETREIAFVNVDGQWNRKETGDSLYDSDAFEELSSDDVKCQVELLIEQCEEDDEMTGVIYMFDAPHIDVDENYNIIII